jgi:hypothetical protein
MDVEKLFKAETHTIVVILPIVQAVEYLPMFAPL